VSPSAADVSVEGHIEPNRGAPGGAGSTAASGATGWHAVVVLRDARGASLGTRDLRRDDASCDAMRAPLVLVIVLMIDPDAALTGPKPPPPPTPPPQPIVIEKPVPVIVRVPEPAPRPPSSWHLDTGGSFIGSVGLLPGPGIGVLGEGILVPPPGSFGIEVYGAAWLDQTVTAGPGTATFWLGYVGGGFCPLVLHGHLLDAFGCLSAQLGYLESYGPTTTPNQGQVHLAAALELRASIHLVGPLTARAGLLGLVPVIRNQFVYDEAGAATGNLYRMNAVAATLDLGLGVAFP
jgi:hypothetical protein